MLQWSKNHKLITLLIALVVLIGLNVWLFGSNFINQKSLVSEQTLLEYNQQLADTAEQASKLAGRNASKPLSSDQLEAAIHPLLRPTDQIIAHLRTADYPTEIDPQVEETLELAEVLSFTLNTYRLEASSELSSAHMAQVFRQTAINASNLNQ